MTEIATVLKNKYVHSISATGAQEMGPLFNRQIKHIVAYDCVKKYGYRFMIY
jgi:hypothetical protein